MLRRQSKASQLADSIISLRDPFLPLTPIRQLLLSTEACGLEEGVSSSLLTQVEDYIGDYALQMSLQHSLLWYEIEEEFPGMLGGVARDKPEFSEERLRIQAEWKELIEFDRSLDDMNPRDFEELGRKILEWYGVSHPYVTRSSGDAGIDFIGEGKLGEIMNVRSSDWTVIDACRVVFVGQAKKYSKTVVGTNELREMVGSVSMMQHNAYKVHHGYGDVQWSVLQPKVILIITTSRFSREALVVGEHAGIILADRDQICKMFSMRRALPDTVVNLASATS